MSADSAAAEVSAAEPAPPAPAAEETSAETAAWFYLGPDGERQGPLECKQLIGMCASSQLPLDTPVWSLWLGEWKRSWMKCLNSPRRPWRRARPQWQQARRSSRGSSSTATASGLPLAADELAPLLSAGTINGESPAWSASLGEWTPLGQVEELKLLVA